MPTPKPPRPPSRDRNKVFIPPSQILRIVRDAELSSDSDDSDSDEEPRMILRDGRPGQKYILRGREKEALGNSSSSDSEPDFPLTEQFLNKPQTPVKTPDLKREYSSGSDIDEFGRRKGRYKRPDSSRSDCLPDLKPGPEDHDSLEEANARLYADTLLIREALMDGKHFVDLRFGREI